MGDDERFAAPAMAGVPVPMVDLRIVGEDGSDAALGRQERGRDPGARAVHRRRLPRGADRAGEVHRRRLAAHRRRRLDRRARLRAHRRPHQGSDQVGRRVDQLGRPGERADGARRGGRSGGDRDPRREVGRAAARLRGAQAGPGVDAERPRRSRAHSARPGLRQMAAARPLRSSSTRCRAPRPASSGRSSCANASRADRFSARAAARQPAHVFLDPGSLHAAHLRRARRLSDRAHTLPRRRRDRHGLDRPPDRFLSRLRRHRHHRARPARRGAEARARRGGGGRRAHDPARREAAGGGRRLGAGLCGDARADAGGHGRRARPA